MQQNNANAHFIHDKQFSALEISSLNKLNNRSHLSH